MDNDLAATAELAFFPAWLLPLAVWAVAAYLDGVRLLRAEVRRPVATWSALLLFLLPFGLTTRTMEGDYVMACVTMCYVLKILELFLCSPPTPDFPDLGEMAHVEFLAWLLTYPDESHLHSWRHVIRKPAKERTTGDWQVLQHGRESSFRLFRDSLFYWTAINVLALLLPPNPAEMFAERSLWNYRFWLLVYLFGWLSYFTLAVTHAVTMGLYGMALGLKIKPIFRQPYLATSLREWWSNRWNLCFKDQYYKIVFRLCLDRPPPSWPNLPFPNGNHNKNHNNAPQLDHKKNDDAPQQHYQGKKQHHQEEQEQQQQQQQHQGRERRKRATTAALATFLFSGLLHDYYAYITFGRIYTPENTLFFLLQGILITAQILLQQRFPQLRRIPTLPAILMTWLTIVGTMPLFLAPYLRGEFYLHLPVPYVVEQGRLSHWLF